MGIRAAQTSSMTKSIANRIRDGVITLPLASFAAERERWILWLPVLFGTGIGLYFALYDEPPVWAGPAAIMVAAGLAILAHRAAMSAFQIVAWMMVTVAAGFTIAQLRTVLVAAPVVEKRIGPTIIEGRITAAEPRGNGVRVWLDEIKGARLKPAQTPARARIVLRGTQSHLRPGERISVRAILYPPPGPAAPGAFDFARRSYFDRLGAVGFAVGKARRIDALREQTIAIQLARLRQHLTERVLAALPGAAGGLAAALMTGERGKIPPDVLDAMRDSGLAHLLAISGLHIGLIGGILFFGIRLIFASMERTTLRWPIKKWAAAVAIVGAFFYLLISGTTVPTQRTFLMLGLVFAAVMLDRLPISMRLVAWAAVAVLLMAPENLLSVSFQMSFAAVIALIAVYEVAMEKLARMRQQHKDRRLPRPLLYLGGVLLSTAVAGLATAPFALYHFNRMAMYGMLANLLAIPLTGMWIMPWALIAFLLMPFGLEALALVPMGWGTGGLIEIARTVQALPGSSTMLPSMPPSALILIALGGLWLCLWRRRWRYFGLVAVAAGMLSVTLVRPPDILIDGKGALMAVMDGQGRLVMSSARKAVKSDIWLRRAGQRESVRWPRNGSGAGGRLRCDGIGCIYRASGHTVAPVNTRDALGEDCRVASVVISRTPVRSWTCRGPLAVIDRFKLWREGPHAVWLMPGSVHIESVARSTGRRPWNLRRNRYRE